MQNKNSVPRKEHDANTKQVNVAKLDQKSNTDLSYTIEAIYESIFDEIIHI